MKRLLLFFAVCFLFSTSFAQISKVTIQASGLTCSMCSNAINKSLKKLEYVDHVDANIKNSTFDVFFKPNAGISFDELKKKVEDAGFFVAKLEANVTFDHLSVSNDAHIELGGIMYHFLNVEDKIINGEKIIQILDKGFLTAKEYKKNARYTKMECYKTGYMGSCCNKKAPSSATRIYHVTI